MPLHRYGSKLHSYLTSVIQFSCRNLQKELNFENHPPQPLLLPFSRNPALTWTFMGFTVNIPYYPYITGEEWWRSSLPTPRINHRRSKITERERLLFPCDPCKPYHVWATVKRRCLGMLLLRSILRKSLGEFLGEITGESLGETDFLAVLDFSCCNRFSRKDFTRSSFSHGLGPCGLSTSGTVKVSGLVVCWAIFLVNFVQLATIQGNVVAWPLSSDSLARSLGNVRESRSDPAAVSSFGRLPQSLGGDGAACRPGERTPCGSLFNVTVLSRAPAKDHWRACKAKNMEGSHSAGSAFVSATKQPVKLLELMRRSCSSDFCLCT